MIRLAVAVFLALVASPALAQAVDVQLGAAATYEHVPSGMRFPPTIGTFNRDKVVRFNGENDVAGSYEAADQSVWASIYLTRVGTPDPSLWFHRVEGVVVARDGFHPTAGADLTATPFVAPGFDRPSGLTLSYAIEPGGRVSATGIALAAYGSFLLKVRMSSDRLTQAELAANLAALMGAMPAPKMLGTEPAPYVVAACPDALTFDPKAKQKKADTGDALMFAMLAGGVGDVVDEEGEPTAPLRHPTYCTDPSSTPALMIYRPDASREGYLMSYNDTGSAVVVGGGGASLLDLLSEETGKGKNPSYAVIHQEPDGNTIYRPFTSLPAPEAVVKIPGNQNPVAKSDRDRNIEIFTQ